MVQVDIVDTETRKARLQEAVRVQEGDLQARMDSIARAEAAIKRTNGEIERRTKEIVMLNRKYEKLVANMEPGEHVGGPHCPASASGFIIQNFSYGSGTQDCL